MISSLSPGDLTGLDLESGSQNEDTTARFQFEGRKQALPFTTGPSYQDFSYSEAVSLGDPITARNPKIQPANASLFALDNLALEPSYTIPSLETQSLMSIELSTEHTSSQADTGTSFPSATYAPSGISSSSDTQNWFHHMSSDQMSLRGKKKPRKRIYPQNGTSVTQSPINKRKADAGKPQPRKDIARLETSLRPYLTTSPNCRQKAAILLRQLYLLIDEVELLGSAQPRPPSRQSSHSSNTSFTTGDIFSQRSLSNSGILDSGYRTEDDTSMSSTPRPLIDDTKNELSTDLETPQLKQDYRIIYGCTKKDCFYSTHLESDWIRHEQGEKHWPQERFMCLACPTPEWDLNGNLICSFCYASFPILSNLRAHYLQCVSAKKDGKTFGRIDHFCKHLREKHRVEHITQHTETWKYAINSSWPRQCGFCGINFQRWEQRMKHIAEHYQNGSKAKDWRLPFHGPKESRKRGFDWKPRDDDSENDDDLDGNNPRRPKGSSSGRSAAKAHPVSQSATAKSGICHYNRLNSQQRAGGSDGARSSIDWWSVQHRRLDKFDSSSAHALPGLALERYLNDDEERIPVIWKPYRPSARGLLIVKAGTSLESHKYSSGSYLGQSQPPRIFGAVLLHPSHKSRKTRLARDYIVKHRGALSEGIFWLTPRLNSGIGGNFWDITRQISLESPKTNYKASLLLQEHFCRAYEDLGSRSPSLDDLSLASYWQYFGALTEDNFLLLILDFRPHISHNRLPSGPESTLRRDALTEKGDYKSLDPDDVRYPSGGHRAFSENSRAGFEAVFTSGIFDMLSYFLESPRGAELPGFSPRPPRLPLLLENQHTVLATKPISMMSSSASTVSTSRDSVAFSISQSSAATSNTSFSSLPPWRQGPP